MNLLLAIFLAVLITLAVSGVLSQPKLRLVIRRVDSPGDLPMKVTETAKFQLVVADRFGNPIPGIPLKNISVSGDPALGDIVADPADPTQFSLVPSGKLGSDSLSASAVATLADGTDKTLSASRTVPLEVGDPETLSIVDVAPVAAN